MKHLKRLISALLLTAVLATAVFASAATIKDVPAKNWAAAWSPSWTFPAGAARNFALANEKDDIFSPRFRAKTDFDFSFCIR